MKVDILAIGVHPDDVELGCSGTIALHQSKGYSVGILDLTRGELGTRGSADLRDQEAAKAAEVLGISYRENLKFADGFFQNDKAHQLELIKIIRKCQPKVILTNAPTDRHPDHGRAAQLTIDANFLSGLAKIETSIDGLAQSRWRAPKVYHYIQDRFIKPDFVVDISDYMEIKFDSIKAYASQFFDPDSKEPSTYISSQLFWDALEGRAREFGRPCKFQFGEGFLVERTIGVNNLMNLI